MAIRLSIKLIKLITPAFAAVRMLAETCHTWCRDKSIPLDLYRTILKLYELRQRVFKDIGGSLMVLSPLGSKIMAIGALLAAMERNLPVAYLEAISYDYNDDYNDDYDKVQEPHQDHAKHKLVHLWLEGDAYPPRSKPQSNGNAKK